ncbi:carboxypeptidase regulatory-like domain-containing protein [Candidatus Bathyarchaeota archaeon]|nr:MAG: carboxypeptidase regulatory-like domain-containing protein [Candidatus Bathyarchaeota archaeon]
MKDSYKVILYGIILVTVFRLGYFAYDTLNTIQPEILDSEGENNTNSETQEILEKETEPITEKPDTSVEETEEYNSSINGTVIGTILDDSGNPISEALIEIGELSTTTNENGSYTLSVPEGTYYVQASKIGYSQEIRLLHILAETTNDEDFSLRKLGIVIGDGNIISVITHRGSDVIDSTEKSFLESNYAIENKIINVQWILSSPQLWNKTITSLSEIDIVWGGEISLYENMYDAGLILPLFSNHIIDLLETIPEQVNGTEIKRVIDGEIYWIVINSEPIALLSTTKDPQLAVLFIEWMLENNIR